MKVKTFIRFFLLLLAALGFFILAACLLAQASAAKAEIPNYVNSPRISSEVGLTGRENESVWLHGNLMPRNGLSTVIGRVSEGRYLYCRFEKLQAFTETDADGESTQVWNVVDGAAEAVDLALRIGDRILAFASGGVLYSNLVSSADLSRTIDGIEFRFREFVVPVENTAWVLGRFASGGLAETDGGLFICLSSPDSLLRSFKATSIALGSFSILSAIAGAGFLGVFLFSLLRGGKRRIRPIDVGMMFCTLGFFWILTGILLLSFSMETLENKLLAAIMGSLSLGGFMVPSLASIGCEPRLGPFLACFPPAIGLVVLGSFFLDRSFFTFSAVFPTMMAGIFCLAAAVVLVQIYRLVLVRQE